MNQTLKKIIILILGFYIFWVLGVPAIFSRVLPVVCENLTYNSDYNIEVKKPRLILTPLPLAVIKADELCIKQKNQEDAAKIKNPKIKIRLLPLLSGKVHINKISAKEIYLSTKIAEEPVLDKDFVKNIYKSKIQLDGVKVENFKIEFFQKEVNSPVVYSGKNVHYRKNGRYIKININSLLEADGRKSEIITNLYLPKNNDVRKSKINVKVSNVNISPLGAYLKNYLPDDFVNLFGIIDIIIDKNHMYGMFKNCAIILKDSSKSIIFPETLEVISDFNITRQTIKILNSVLKSQNININFDGTISNYLDKSLPDFNLNFHIDKSRVEDLINMLPAIRAEEFDVYKLKKYKFYGDIIGNLNIKGHNIEPLINGDIFINNGILTKPIKDTKGATIKLEFLGKYLNYDAFVPASQSEKVWVKGGVELYNIKYADLRVWSTPNVDLAVAQEKVVPIHEILNFVIGPVPIMDIKGTGNIDITVKGNRKNPHVWGNLNFKDVTTYFTDIPDIIMKKGNAVLNFNDENVQFKLSDGILNNKPLSIDGTCNLSGKFDFDVSSKNQEISYLYNALMNSKELIKDVKLMLPKLDKISGPANFNIKVYGAVKYIEDLKYNENFFTKGHLDFLGNSIGINGVSVNSIEGTADFDGTNAELDVSSAIGKSNFNSKAIIKNNMADFVLTSNLLNLSDILSQNSSLPDNLGNIFINLNAKYKGRIDNIEYNNIDMTANILKTGKQNKLQIKSGDVSLKKGKLSINNIHGNFVDSGSSFDLNVIIDNIFAKPLYYGNVALKDFELSILNTLSEYSVLPQDIRNLINLIKFEKGKINLNAVLRNNSINASTNLGGIAFVYLPQNISVKIVNGSLYARKNYVGLNKINMLADDMPILIDGEISNLFGKPDFNILINTKPKQYFVDKYINNTQIYPIKLKGDIILKSQIKGTNDNINIKSSANLAKDSSIYYLGATIGDVENGIELNLDTDVIKQKFLKIKEFSYDKLIASQGTRQTRLNMLKASGGVELKKDDLNFQDFKIKTQKPTDARIFNIIFRKPNIKQGQFTSDLKLNGYLSNPKIIGTFHIFETNIPFMDTVMKNITFIFKDKTIDISSTGEVLGNEIKFKGTFKNKFTTPYYVETAELYTKVLDLNYIINKLKMSQVDEHTAFNSLDKFDFNNLIIKKLKMNANGIKLRNLIAENVEANASLDEKHQLSINNFSFDVAHGSLSGDFGYNIATYNSNLKLKANDINANDISYAIFDLNNQIYGNLTGNIQVSCIGSEFSKCMETLNGTTDFKVTNGRMPKLGSLEYLLKAGNLIKGGLTGLSINSVIDIITPLKTGDFSTINGNIRISDGIAKNLEITTEGKDLNLYISGNYNFATSIADMEVFGLLSKNISTMFGPIGNVSINTLFNVIPGVNLEKDSPILKNINKIPGIEISSKSFRKFIAEIKGNINGDNYVKSFKWIN